MNEYIINEWALVRRNELVGIPKEFEVHPDFLRDISKEDFESAFRQIWNMTYQVMTDLADDPAHFGMPMAKISETPYGAAIAQESRFAAWRPMKLINLLFRNGTVKNGCLHVNAAGLKKENRYKNIHILLKAWSDYGFVSEGLKDYKITPSVTEFFVSYPDNFHVITVLSLMAKKAQSVDHDVMSRNDCFCTCSYRLFLEGFGEYSYDDPYFTLYDKMHGDRDREFVGAYHKALTENGFCYGHGGWNEGPGICYYSTPAVRDKKGPYLFRILSWKGDLQVMLRIRSAEKCFSYLENCPESIKDMFRQTASGCANRPNCTKGVGYVYEGKEKWKCGCCSAPFVTKPDIGDIGHYIKLVELGQNR